MGKAHQILSSEQIDEYLLLTYLTKAEILFLLQKFLRALPSNAKKNINYCFPPPTIIEMFPELNHNPFRERIIQVFSSNQDETFCFEDCLDLCSVMSENCPISVKATWAFKIFDFNKDNEITKSDLFQLIDRLTRPSLLSDDEKDEICDILLDDIDLSNTGGMNHLEFLHAITKMPEFAQVFSFKL